MAIYKYQQLFCFFNFFVDACSEKYVHPALKIEASKEEHIDMIRILVTEGAGKHIIHHCMSLTAPLKKDIRGHQFHLEVLGSVRVDEVET